MKSSETIKDRISELCEVVSMHHSELCGLLIQVRDRQLYLDWGCETFHDYAASLPVEQGTVYHLVESYDRLTERGLTESQAIKAFATNGLSRVMDAIEITEDVESLQNTLDGHGYTDLGDRKAVQKAKVRKFLKMTVRFEDEMGYNKVAAAFELARREYSFGQARALEAMADLFLMDEGKVYVEKPLDTDSEDMIQ